MNKVQIRPSIVDRVVARRASCTSSIRSTEKAALLVIDMQNAFVAPGAPVEVPVARGDCVSPRTAIARSLAIHRI
jgi:hypothetical protein